MKVTIHYNGRYEDELRFECETIEEAREIAYRESEVRGWEEKHCWSEVEEDELSQYYER